MRSRREFGIDAARLLAAAGATGVGSAWTSPALADAPPNHRLLDVDPELRPPLRAMLQAPPMHFSQGTLLGLRTRLDGFALPPLARPVPIRRETAGTRGGSSVPVFIIGATPGAAKPAVLHLHGGGFIAGSARASLRAAQALSLAHDCVVVSVDYRLAPEAPFPAPLDDAYQALLWLHDHAAELGVDRRRIAIKGESAGGGLAAMLALAARDRGGPSIGCQVLIYPMLDDRTGSSRQPPPSLGRYVWTPDSNRFGWTSLLGAPAGGPTAPPGAVPARATDLSGLPPTFIGVGSIDLFAPEDLEYARRLVEAGTRTELLLVPGAYHGFDTFAPEAPLSKAFDAAWNAALHRAFVGGSA